jgi:hypothetical protein
MSYWCNTTLDPSDIETVIWKNGQDNFVVSKPVDSGAFLCHCSGSFWDNLAIILSCVKSFGNLEMIYR